MAGQQPASSHGVADGHGAPDTSNIVFHFRWTLELSETDWKTTKEHWVKVANVERFEANLSPPLQGDGPVSVLLTPLKEPEVLACIKVHPVHAHARSESTR